MSLAHRLIAVWFVSVAALGGHAARAEAPAADVSGVDSLSKDDVKNVLYFHRHYRDANHHYQPPTAVNLDAGTVAIDENMRTALQKSIDNLQKGAYAAQIGDFASNCGSKTPIKMTVDIALTLAQGAEPQPMTFFANTWLEGLYGACGGAPNPPNAAGKAYMSKVRAIHFKLGEESHGIKGHPEMAPWDHASFDKNSGTLTLWISQLGNPGNTADAVTAWVLQQQ